MSTDIMPSVAEWATGKVRASRIRPVEIEDLLGRDPVDLDTDDIRSLIQNKTVMVTGAGGSIGSELCRQIMLNGPKRLILLEQCEVQLYGIEMELRQSLGGGAGVLPLVADVLTRADRREWNATILRLLSEYLDAHTAPAPRISTRQRLLGRLPAVLKRKGTPA